MVWEVKQRVLGNGIKNKKNEMILGKTQVKESQADFNGTLGICVWERKLTKC